jgi:hypothetical protein
MVPGVSHRGRRKGEGVGGASEADRIKPLLTARLAEK